MANFVAEAEVWKRTRNETIRRLHQLADELDLMQKRVNISNLTATSVSLATGIGSIVCFGLAVVTGGISIIPGIVLAGVGGGSAVTSVGTFLGKRFHEKDLLKKVQQALDNDRRESERLDITLGNLQTTKSDIEGNRVARGGIGSAKMVARGIDLGAGIANSVRGGTQATFRTVSQVAGAFGFAFDLVLLPVDIYFLVETSIKTHNGSTHEAAYEIREIAEKLRRRMIEFLAELQD